MTYFLGFLYPLKVQEGEDTLFWKEVRRGIFSVKSYYCSLRMENNAVFLGKGVWGSRAPLRTCFFCLGSCLGENLNYRYFNDEGMTNDQ